MKTKMAHRADSTSDPPLALQAQNRKLHTQIDKLQKKILTLQNKILNLENKAFKLENKTLKQERSILQLQGENERLAKTIANGSADRLNELIAAAKAGPIPRGKSYHE
jgi:TolA-binding protein